LTLFLDLADPLVVTLAQEAQTKYMDARKSGREFKAGDLVLLKFNRRLEVLGTTAIVIRPCQEALLQAWSFVDSCSYHQKLLAYKIALPAGSKMHDVVSGRPPSGVQAPLRNWVITGDFFKKNLQNLTRGLWCDPWSSIFCILLHCLNTRRSQLS